MSLLELGLVALHAVTGWLIAELSIIDWVEGAPSSHVPFSVPGDIGDNTRVLCRITNTYREIRYKLVRVLSVGMTQVALLLNLLNVIGTVAPDGIWQPL